MVSSGFHKRLETPHGFINFYFNRILTEAGAHFHVHFVSKNLTHMFHMVESDEQWHVADKHKHPEWLLNMEEHFRYHIAEHLAY